MPFYVYPSNASLLIVFYPHSYFSFFYFLFAPFASRHVFLGFWGALKSKCFEFFPFPFLFRACTTTLHCLFWGNLTFQENKSFLSFRLGGFSFNFFYWVLGCAFDELGWAVFYQIFLSCFSLLHACGRMVGCLSLFFRSCFEDTLFFFLFLFLSFLMLSFFFLFLCLLYDVLPLRRF